MQLAIFSQITPVALTVLWGNNEGQRGESGRLANFWSGTREAWRPATLRRGGSERYPENSCGRLRRYAEIIV
jgi:hypothetical protein